METNERLIKAVQTATKKLGSSGGTFDAVLKAVLAICVEAVGASGGTIYVHDAAARRLRFQHVLPEEVADKLPSKDIADDYGAAGQAFQERQTVCREIPPKPQLSDFEQATGVVLRSIIACPLMIEGEQPIGVVQLLNKIDGTFNETDAAVLETIAGVATMAYLNSRLMEESTRASTLLGMGKVSHDIGNLAASLYASLSFSELALQGLKDELGQSQQSNEMVEMYVESLGGMFGDIMKSVDRIVGYSRLISDLSVGRSLRPNKICAPLSDTIQTSAAYLESEGRQNHVALRYEIQSDAPPLLHDELYLFRIVQNLVGNAIKAVKETIPEDWRAHVEGDDEDVILGEVTIRYKFCENNHIIEVQDTGPGMSRETAERILKGVARSQWDKGGGSGWGTKIVLELAGTHDAKVSIDSELGHGSIFRVVFPHVEVPQETVGAH